MTEILIVIGIIVLLLAIAVPAFNLISGGKSIEGATNQLSAALGRARASAIGLQKTTGVMFFVDPSNDRRTIAIVQETDAPPAVTANPAPDVWLDLLDADYLPLPAGVSAQLINDCIFTPVNSTTRGSDGYIGYNFNAHQATSAAAATLDPKRGLFFGGVILFDGNGMLTSKTYGFRCMSQGPDGRYYATAMGKLLQPVAMPPDGSGNSFDAIPGPSNFAPRSQFGLVMYATDLFVNGTANGKSLTQLETDPLIAGTQYTNLDEGAEETWLDNNATPLMINRYNGTLVKGE